MTAAKDDGGIEEFIRIWEAWQSILPKSLRRGDPKVLIRLLQQIESGNDIFQMESKG